MKSFTKTLISSVLLTASMTASAVGYQPENSVLSGASGGEGGGYEALINMTMRSIMQQKGADQYFTEANNVNTNGTIENLEMFNAGEVALTVIQADGANAFPPSLPFKAKKAHTEKAFWVYNLNNGISDLKDLEGREDMIMVMAEGSGGFVTMNSFVQEDGGYKVNLEKAHMADDLYDAASIVADGNVNGKKVAGFLYVGKKLPAEIGQDFGRDLRIGELTDGDFNDAEDVNGDPLYTKCDIEDVEMGGLTDEVMGAPDTVCQSAFVIYRADMPKNMQRIVQKGVIKATRNLQ